MKNIFAITKKELRSFFDSPTAYIVLIVFLLLWEFLFFRSVFLVGQASLFSMFFLLPWLFLILIPALTMASVAQEKSEGTLELLLTHPITEKELIFGKFLAIFIFAAITLLFIFPIAISLNNFGDIDWGVIWGQYLAGVFLAAMFIALGIFVSALLANQISALLVSAAFGFVFLIAGFELVTASLPLWLASSMERLSALSHYGSMSRGVIDLRDLWYFIAGTLIFLALAYLWLLRRKFGNRKMLYGKYQLAVLIFIAAAVLLNFLGASIPGRIDLTAGRLYTLTPATKKVIGEIKDSVTISLYASDELPAQMQPILREVKDILRDYKTIGKGRIAVAVKNPQSDQKILEEALNKGVREVQFNVVEQEGFQVKKGFLGLAVTYGEKNESIPFIERTSDLEYSLTSFIKKLTITHKKSVAFLAGHGEKNIYSEYGSLREELSGQFDIEELRLETATSSVPADTAALIIAGPALEISSSARNAIKAYLENGGSAMILIDSTRVNAQGLTVSLNENNFADFLEDYGVKVNKDITYDLRSNETVSFGGGFITYTLPYPLWVRALALDKTSPLAARVENLSLPWVSSIELNDEKIAKLDLAAKELYGTTKFGGRQTENFKVDPNTQYSSQNLGEQIMAVSLTRTIDDDQSTTQRPFRLLVVGDSDFLTDQFTGPKYSNLAFGIEAISWLAEEESLAGIQLRSRKDRALVFENDTQKTLIKYGNMGLALVLPLAFGGFRMLRRKALRRARY